MHLYILTNVLRKIGSDRLSLQLLHTMRQPGWRASTAPATDHMPQAWAVLNDQLHTDEAALRRTLREVQRAFPPLTAPNATADAEAAAAEGMRAAMVRMGVAAVQERRREAERVLVRRAVVVLLVGPRTEHMLDLLSAMRYLVAHFLSRCVQSATDADRAIVRADALMNTYSRQS
jgi:hypothetical protein